HVLLTLSRLITVTSTTSPNHTPIPYTTLFRSREKYRSEDHHAHNDKGNTAHPLGFPPYPGIFNGPGRPHAHKIVGADLRHIISRSEEHKSELQSRFDLVCRLLLEKKKSVICDI